MKLKGQPILLRTIKGEVEHKGKLYEVTIDEISQDENDFEIWEVNPNPEGLEYYLEEIDPDSKLGEKLIEFFLIETEDIEQFQ
jgi:NMD protein affecting ribosome stability and mRNA decay